MNLRRLAQALGVVLVLAGLLCMGWTRLRLPMLPRLGLYIALALVFLGIRTMAEGAYASQLSWIIRTIVTVTALMVGWSLVQWLKERWVAMRASREASSASEE